MRNHHRTIQLVAIGALACLVACSDDSSASNSDATAVDQTDALDSDAPLDDTREGDALADLSDGTQSPGPLGLSGVNVPDGVCATVADAPCGGDISGVWQLEDFCTPEPAGSDIPCEGPGEDEPDCDGEAGVRICNLLYGGTANFTSDTIEAGFSVGLRVRYSFNDVCLAAIGGGAEGEAACSSLGNDRLSCEYSDDSCDCDAESEPESERNDIAFTVEGDRITVGDGERAVSGSYCVQDDLLTIVFDLFGPEGWRAWVLTRSTDE